MEPINNMGMIRNIFKNIYDYIKLEYRHSFTKSGREAYMLMVKRMKCKHEHWNCDIQIRTIECKECGLRAWIDDYTDLYKK